MEMDNRDIIKIYFENFHGKLDAEIAMQCAPLILGRKISNLFITAKENSQEVKRLFLFFGFSTCLLHKGEKKVILLIYDKRSFWNYIEREECSRFLEMYGYCMKQEKRTKELFQKITERFSEYMETKQGFPHELGILLGYPLKDVQGFIEHRGKDFLYNGYWKVYSDLQNALATFESYDRAKSILLNMLVKGFSIKEILGICRSFT